MALWQDLAWETPDIEDMGGISPEYRELRRRGVIIERMWEFPDEMHIVFGWNCATFASAVSSAARYVHKRYETTEYELIHDPSSWRHWFELVFVPCD
jgi:hypothetical protein